MSPTTGYDSPYEKEGDSYNSGKKDGYNSLDEEDFEVPGKSDDNDSEPDQKPKTVH